MNIKDISNHIRLQVLFFGLDLHLFLFHNPLFYLFPGRKISELRRAMDRERLYNYLNVDLISASVCFEESITLAVLKNEKAKHITLFPACAGFVWIYPGMVCYFHN
jgi:hypothetical protein